MPASNLWRSICGSKIEKKLFTINPLHECSVMFLSKRLPNRLGASELRTMYSKVK